MSYVPSLKKQKRSVISKGRQLLTELGEERWQGWAGRGYSSLKAQAP